MLLANATVAARLSPSGVLIARGLLEGQAETEITDRLRRFFRGATAEHITQDLGRVRSLLTELAEPGDNYPIINLDDAAVSAEATHLIAPLEATVPLGPPEVLTPIIDRLWQVAIPHLTVLAPIGSADPMWPAHLVRAIERAEDLGMIAGVRGRSSDLDDGNLLKRLALAGADHITVLYAAADSAVHDSFCGPGDHAAAERVIGEAQTLEIAAVAETPLVESTLSVLGATLNRLLALDVTNISFFAIAAREGVNDEVRADALASKAMPQVASLVEEAAHEARVRFIWQPPVTREPAYTVAQQIQLGPRCSGDVSVRVELDGSVIPARGPHRSAGNILTQHWGAIWDDDAFRRYRARVEAATRCDVCPGLALCAADCPQNAAGWSTYPQGGATR
jgi:radical SAM protein with 4Fe4S-binding SPASM domain